MKKLDFPDDYGVYHIGQEKFYVLDPVNYALIQRARRNYGAFFCIPEEKEVECFVMDYDKEVNIHHVNFDKKVKVKMKLLEELPCHI